MKYYYSFFCQESIFHLCFRLVKFYFMLLLLLLVLVEQVQSMSIFLDSYFKNDLGFPICITCYSRVDGEYYCNGCSWQCCDEQCELRDVHREECEIFKEKDIYAAWNSVDEPTLSMDFMGPHRLLLAIKKDPTLKILLKKDMQNELRQSNII